MQSSLDPRLEFTGNAREYFGIWIVNILLSLLTLGIYSAWAKVRTKRWFYGHTRLEGNPFEYTGKPIAILKGRLIAAGALGIYAGTTYLYPQTDRLFSLLFLVALPWIVVRSLRFNAYHSLWRNIRFHFRGEYGQAAKAYVWMPILATLTLGLLTPRMLREQAAFFAENSHFGGKRFDFGAMTRDYTRIFWGGLGILLFFAVLGFFIYRLVLGLYAPPMDMASHPEGMKTYVTNVGLMLILPLGLLYLVLFGYFKAALGNLFWNSVGLSGVRFGSRLEAHRLIWLYLTNALAIMFSLGLLAPWAKVRLTRYRVSRMALAAPDGVEEFAAMAEAAPQAAGEEMGDLFDVDVGL